MINETKLRRRALLLQELIQELLLALLIKTSLIILNSRLGNSLPCRICWRRQADILLSALYRVAWHIGSSREWLSWGSSRHRECESIYTPRQIEAALHIACKITITQLLPYEEMEPCIKSQADLAVPSEFGSASWKAAVIILQVAVSVSNLNATAEGARQVAAGVARNVINSVTKVGFITSQKDRRQQRFCRKL